MKLPLKAFLAVVLAGAVIPGVASATTLNIGVTKSPLVAPVCPGGPSLKTLTALGNCRIVLAKTTALPSHSDGVLNPTTVGTNGEIVSLTVGVSNITTDKATRKKAISDIDESDGGAPAIRLTVLRPVGKASNFTWRVATQSPTIPIISYLGKVVQLPLIAPLAVTRGEVVALTVPTWAPVLDVGLSKAMFNYRQSHSTNCANNSKQTSTLNPLTTVGELAGFGCIYTAARAEFSATEVTSPPA